MSPSTPHQDPPRADQDDTDLLAEDEAAEEILPDDGDGDAAMDSGSEADAEPGRVLQDEDDDDDDDEEIILHNDSLAHFDRHPDSIFCVAAHPTRPQIVATGGSEGEDRGGIGYIFDSTPLPEAAPVLPASYEAAPSDGRRPRAGLEAMLELTGHTDSINALAFTLPDGDFLCSAGLDGQLRVYQGAQTAKDWRFAGSVQEVTEINWVAPCPRKDRPNVIALGASDGSVWVYQIDASDADAPLQIVQSYFWHTASCTAGAWSTQGHLLATVAEDGGLAVWDVFGEAAGQGLANGQTVVALTSEDQRFAVDGGLYSVAIAPTDTFVAVGGANGSIKIVSLPRLATAAASGGAKNAPAKNRGGKAAASSTGQAGQILADLQTQSDGIETLSFAVEPLTLLAAGSVDGSIAVFDTSRNFGVKRHIRDAHEGGAVVKVAFLGGDDGARSRTEQGLPEDEKWLLTSCGIDGVVRRWDLRGTSRADGEEKGLVREWRGHRGEVDGDGDDGGGGGGGGGGVLDFVQAGGHDGFVVTAGDDGVSLVFGGGGVLGR